MVDLSGGQDGPIEHGFSNSVFVIPGIIFITLSVFVTLRIGWLGIKDMEEEKLGGDIPSIPSMDDMPIPTVEDLLEALDGFTGMSDEEKESIRAQLQAGGMQNLMGNAGQGFSFQQFFILIALLLVVAFIFVFFGYKLYKSLVEKDRKREEKRKMKQMKKKK